MSPGDGATWLPSVLLLLQVPGCLLLSGPRNVRGTVGGSLSVQCRYEEEYTEYMKLWCKGSCLLSMKIVKTTKTEREVRSGRVSIRDDPANLAFTVTLESLTEDDEGTYECGIAIPGYSGLLEKTIQVVLSVLPAPTGTDAPKLKTSRSTQGLPSSLPVTTYPSVTRPEPPDPSQHPRSLLRSVHFLLLVFLKLPLLLSMLSAVLWVHRPQRGSGGRWGQLC